MMFLKSLTAHLRGLYLGLAVVLGICLVLNLGALIFSLSILTRGNREYSMSRYTILPNPGLTNTSLSCW